MSQKTTIFVKKIGEAERGRQRFYEFSNPITRSVDGESVEDALAPGRSSVPEHLEYLVSPETKSWTLFCVSDSMYHSERLVFPACVHDGELDMLCGWAVAGVTTMMIDGGNPETIRPDIEYLQQIAESNGYDFGGLQLTAPGDQP